MIPCVSFGFEPFVRVRDGPISLQLLAFELTEVHTNAYQFVGVADSVADRKRSLSRGSGRRPDRIPHRSRPPGANGPMKAVGACAEP